MTASCTARKFSRTSIGFEQLGEQFLNDIPNVAQIVSPLALEVDLTRFTGTPSTPIRSPAFVEPRYYTLRCECMDQTTAHVFFMGLATGSDDDMTAGGAGKIARLMNDQELVTSLGNKYDVCDAPFSHCTITDLVDNELTLKIEGVAYHCHCSNHFSHECWTAAFSAAEKTAMVCKNLRRAKASLRV